MLLYSKQVYESVGSQQFRIPQAGHWERAICIAPAVRSLGVVAIADQWG